MSSLRILRRVQVQVPAQESWTVPIYFCPRLGKCLSTSSLRARRNWNNLKSPNRLYSSLDATSTHLWPEAPLTKATALPALPWTCPGCGAYTQNVSPDEAGYYSPTRKSVRAFLGKLASMNEESKVKDSAPDNTIREVGDSTLRGIKLNDQLHANTGTIYISESFNARY